MATVRMLLPNQSAVVTLRPSTYLVFFFDSFINSWTPGKVISAKDTLMGYLLAHEIALRCKRTTWELLRQYEEGCCSWYEVSFNLA